MRNILIVLAMAFSVLLSLNGHKPSGQPESPIFEKAVEIIKKYESLHSARHWPFVGYGHLVLKGEKFKKGKPLSEKEADALLRKDLKKLCALYRDFGADSIILGALAYNCGPGVVARSSVLRKLREGNRDIKTAYLAHCRSKGKVLTGLRKRRQEEYTVLFTP